MTAPPGGVAAGDEPLTVRIAEDRWTTLRHVVESFAIIAAGLWAFYVFVYQERIKPAGDPASLTTSIAVRRLGYDARRDVLSVDVRLTNSGKTEIDVAADAINVWGKRYASRDATVALANPISREYRHNVPLQSRTLIEAFGELRDRSVGGKRGRHIILVPGAVEEFSTLVALMRGKYDVVEAQVIVVPVKTTPADQVSIAVTSDWAAGVRLHPRTPDVQEDDNSTNFALIPER